MISLPGLITQNDVNKPMNSQKYTINYDTPLINSPSVSLNNYVNNNNIYRSVDKDGYEMARSVDKKIYVI